MYLILFVLGLLIGAVFLAVLLVGDRREARLEAQREALREQMGAAGEPVEGVWPPPPSVSALPRITEPASPPRAPLAPGANQNLVWKFFRYRGYVVATVIVAFIIHDAYPQFNFGWVLLATALAAGGVAVLVTRLGKSRRSSGRL